MARREEGSSEVSWTDARIRWPDEKVTSVRNDDEEVEETALFDPFKDPNPYQEFSFEFKLESILEVENNSNLEKFVNISLRGHKSDSDGVWESTGLTLWKSSEYLCNFQIKHCEMFEGKRIIELGAGLGLNGILAWKMTSTSDVFITDGDSDALVLLRENIDRNMPVRDVSCSSRVSCHQLIWGRDTAALFLEKFSLGKKFEIIVASDIIYAKCIIKPLWDTVNTLLCEKDGIFVLAFARREVPVSREFVLQSANEAGYTHELANEDSSGLWVDIFRRNICNK